MADGRHFENRYIHISAANRPNMTKYGMQTHIMTQATKREKILEIPKFKMVDGRHIENHFFAITQLHTVPLRRNLE